MESTEAEKLQAGREGDRVIAELLGWHLASNDRHWDNGHPPGAVFWIATPQDKRNSALGWDTAEQAWNDAAKWRIPHYTTSVDVAFGLLPPNLTVSLDKHISHQSGAAVIHWSATIDARGKQECDGNAESPALAICRAWLAWKTRETRE